MKKLLSLCFTLVLTLPLVMVTASCDQVEKVASGVGGSKSSSSDSDGSSATRDAGDTSDSAGENGSEDPDDGDAIQVAQADTKQEDLVKIRLNAFTDFNCSDAWTERDGGWGLRAGSGSGDCTAAFPGDGGSYRVVLMAQLEFDGNPNFRIEVDGQTIAAGSYPMSMGELICDCPNWRINCPDRVVPIDAGVHEIGKGSSILFVGAEVYPCGGSHGAYAKWQELVFTPEE